MTTTTGRRAGVVLVAALVLGALAPLQHQDALAAAERGQQVRRPEPARALPGPARRLLWSDEFSGPAGSPPDPRTWWAEQGGHGWGNDELQTYTDRARNVALDGRGRLVLTARRETHTGADGHERHWTSARVSTKGLRETTYGRYEARLRVPAGQGLWPAFWMLGHDNWTAGWPESGEIDVMEALNSADGMHTTLHGPSSTAPRGVWSIGTRTAASPSLSRGFHRYAVEWRKDRVRFELDGRAVATVRRSQVPPGGRWVFDKPFFLLLNVAVGGWAGPPDATTPDEASLLVDWVRVYR